MHACKFCCCCHANFPFEIYFICSIPYSNSIGKCRNKAQLFIVSLSVCACGLAYMRLRVKQFHAPTQTILRSTRSRCSPIAPTASPCLRLRICCGRWENCSLQNWFREFEKVNSLFKSFAATYSAKRRYHCAALHIALLWCAATSVLGHFGLMPVHDRRTRNFYKFFMQISCTSYKFLVRVSPSYDRCAHQLRSSATLVQGLWHRPWTEVT